MFKLKNCCIRVSRLNNTLKKLSWTKIKSNSFVSIFLSLSSLYYLYSYIALLFPTFFFFILILHFSCLPTSTYIFTIWYKNNIHTRIFCGHERITWTKRENELKRKNLGRNRFVFYGCLWKAYSKYKFSIYKMHF